MSGSFTTMQYSHNERYIALASCYSRVIWIYSLVKKKLYAVAKLGNIIREVQWTIDDHYLLVSLPQNEFRIVETERYTSDKWTAFSQPISTFFSTNTENEAFLIIENSCLMYKLVKSDTKEDMGNTPYVFSNLVFDFGFKK